MIYVMGSLHCDRVPVVAQRLRDAGHEVFDCWYAAGPDADTYWQKYEQARGHTYRDALNNYPAHHVFDYDVCFLRRADVGVLVLPAGKSAHMEMGYLIGRGRPAYILLDGEPERWDVMYKLATVVSSVDELIARLA